MLVLFLKTQFLIWIRDKKPAGIWARISKTESGYDNHWATLHWLEWQIIVNFTFKIWLLFSLAGDFWVLGISWNLSYFRTIVKYWRVFWCYQIQKFRFIEVFADQFYSLQCSFCLGSGVFNVHLPVQYVIMWMLHQGHSCYFTGN